MQNADCYKKAVSWKKCSVHFYLYPFVTALQTQYKMLHAVAAVQLCQQNAVLLHNCDINCCIDIYKLMAQILPLFFLSINTEDSSNELFNTKRDLDCSREMLLDLHFCNVVLKFSHQ